MCRTSFPNYFKGVVAAALAAVTISACSKAEAPTGETIDSGISVQGGTVIKADAAATTLEVKLLLSGPGAAEKVGVASSESWVSETVAPSEEGSGSGSLLDGLLSKADAGSEEVSRSVWLALEENGSSSSRTATVTLSLKGAKDVKLTLIQGANPDYVINSQVTFSLDVTDITETTAKFTVAPSISDCYYLYAFVPESDFKRYDDAREYVDSAVAQIKAYAVEYEKKYETPFVLKNRLYKGYYSATASGLSPETDYCLVAFDITLNYGYSGNSAVYKFKTASVPPSSGDFTITYDEATGYVWCTPAESASGSFGCGLCTADYWDSSKAPSVVVDSYVESSSFSPYSVSGGARGIPMKSLSDVAAGTEYVAFAFIYNLSTGKASNIAWLRFTYND